MRSLHGASLLVAGIILVGCSKEPSSNPVASVPAAGGELPPVGLRVGNLAPEIEGVDIDGNAFKLSAYRGRVVMLDFWGNW